MNDKDFRLSEHDGDDPEVIADCIECEESENIKQVIYETHIMLETLIEHFKLGGKYIEKINALEQEDKDAMH